MIISPSPSLPIIALEPAGPPKIPPFNIRDQLEAKSVKILEMTCLGRQGEGDRANIDNETGEWKVVIWRRR